MQPSRIAGTSYAVADEPKLVRIGQQQAFETVYLFDDGVCRRAFCGNWWTTTGDPRRKARWRFTVAGPLAERTESSRKVRILPAQNAIN